jgi:hypothetical protein
MTRREAEDRARYLVSLSAFIHVWQVGLTGSCLHVFGGPSAMSATSATSSMALADQTSTNAMLLHILDADDHVCCWCQQRPAAQGDLGPVCSTECMGAVLSVLRGQSPLRLHQ